MLSSSIRFFDGAPTFHHPEAIRPLYETGFEIDRRFLYDMLSLPRPSPGRPWRLAASKVF
ncbi:MAG: hypothetical protein ACOX9C_02080 [Kiritimatiellia bacterium]|jgi:hypothetical protein